MSTSIVHGRYLIVRPDHVIDHGALLVRDDVIEAVGQFDDLKRNHPVDEVIGGPGHIVIPGLVNAHHHGRGTAAYLGGLADDTLERWLLGVPASRSGLGARMGALISAMALIRSGTTTVLHNHLGPGVLEAVEGYAASGLRVAFSSAYIERAFYAYDDDSFLGTLPNDLAQRARGMLGGEPPSHDDYFALVDELASATKRMGDRARVLVSPVGIYWASDDFLVRAREEATRRGVGIHMHLLETPYQRAADQRLHGASAVEHLDKLGVLGPDVSFAHGVWADKKDIDLLSQYNCAVCHCPSSNLRLRNGLAPVVAMAHANVPLALGTDGLSFNDDDDLLHEMALAVRLHNSPALDSEPLQTADVFSMATTGGAHLTGFDRIGTLDVGSRADLVLISWQRAMSGYTELDIDPVSLLVHGIRSADVDTVMVNGDVVYRDKRFTHLDESALLAEATQELNSTPVRSRESASFVAEITPYLERYYADLLRSG